MLRRSGSHPSVRIVSPALASANNGNAHTAARWQALLQSVADCTVALQWHSGDGGDLLVALHARRSASSIAAFHAAHPERPIVLVLTGTDVYGELSDDPTARHSLECASAVVVLQAAALARLDAASRAKAVVIVQSARKLTLRSPAATDGAPFVAVGHLRDEKDPLTVMRAVRLAAPALALDHVGAALDPAFGDAAVRTMAACPSYRWLGALPHAAARRRIATARALVHASRLEGGANVIVEAVRSGVPVLASRIDGNVGLLGDGYDGYFAVGDAEALAQAMRRFAHDSAFAAALVGQCAAREPLFRPAAERAAVRGLVAGLLRHGALHADRIRP